jgi:hypothetical protein
MPELDRLTPVNVTHGVVLIGVSGVVMSRKESGVILDAGIIVLVNGSKRAWAEVKTRISE